METDKPHQRNKSYKNHRILELKNKQSLQLTGWTQ